MQKSAKEATFRLSIDVDDDVSKSVEGVSSIEYFTTLTTDENTIALLKKIFDDAPMVNTYQFTEK